MARSNWLYCMKTPILFLIAALSFSFANSFAQNYLGYSKEFILKALKSQRKDMKGPLLVKAVNDNFICYIAKDGGRVVYYHFVIRTITSEAGGSSQEEICVRYFSKSRCQSNSNCPEMDKVVRSLDSHFVPSGQHLTWIDYNKTVPHEWVIVRDDDYFEVYVTELK